MTMQAQVKNETLIGLIMAETVLIRATEAARLESVVYTPSDIWNCEIIPWRNQYVADHTADQQATRDALCEDAGFTPDEWQGHWQTMLRDAEALSEIY